MPKKGYSWKDGPDYIQQHSIAKHHLLQSYLSEYFRTLASSPSQDELRLTLVDGFSGGGLYIHNDTRQLVEGSPFIFLNAACEAEAFINSNRRKHVYFKVDYFFVEPDKHAYMHLEKVLIEKGYGSQIGSTIHLKKAQFHTQADAIINFIRNKSPRNGRSIFVLDQYGYKDVPTQLIQRIFSQLPSSEVILTFGVDSFLNYASDGELSQALLDRIGIPNVLQGRSMDDIKNSERDWRLFIQSRLYKELVAACGAKHYTPFFIRNKRGHGDYWLIHLSQHHRARDVMTEVHWKNSNYFIHYGGPGLDMFMNGYDPSHDSIYKGQSTFGFEFDDIARGASIAALKEHIPRLIYANDVGLSFGELFSTTCNESPASAEIYREAIIQLMDEKLIEVTSTDDISRRSALQIRPSDQITAPAQKGFIFINKC